MITISLCMIVKNEEDVIGDCLNSVKDIVDEINIVDTGSTDKTKEIILQFTDRIFDFKWIDDFAAARNASFSHATKEYILWLDADDIFLEEDQKALLELKRTLEKDVDCVTFKYNYAQDEYGNPTLIFRRERLVRRDKGFPWIGFIHEYIGGNKTMVVDSEITVTHKRVHSSGDRNLNIYKKKIADGISFNYRDRYYYGKELYYHGIYEEAIQVLGKLLDEPIWIEEKIDSACKVADSYMGLNDLDRAKKTLLRAFLWGSPRAEIIYRIGQVCERQNKIEEAIYWYESISNAILPEKLNGFTYIEYWTWRPYIQLCVCYSKIGDIHKSYLNNEKARAISPNQTYVIHNIEYFKSIGYQID